MKAKEYAAKVLEANTQEEFETALVAATNGFFDEMRVLKDARRVLLDGSMIAIVKELDQKFRKFAVLVNQFAPASYGKVRPEGFVNALEKLYPAIHHFYAHSMYHSLTTQMLTSKAQ